MFLEADWFLATKFYFSFVYMKTWNSKIELNKVSFNLAFQITVFFYNTVVLFQKNRDKLINNTKRWMNDTRREKAGRITSYPFVAERHQKLLSLQDIRYAHWSIVVCYIFHWKTPRGRGINVRMCMYLFNPPNCIWN